MTKKPFHLGAVLYSGFEMLDLFGPLEMFSILGSGEVAIHLLAEKAGPVSSAMGFDGAVGPRVLADACFADAPALDMLLVPGGSGTRAELENPVLLDFLRERAATASIVASVCTGSALLARAGLLDGRRATSNKQFFALATLQPSTATWVEAARWIEDGSFFTSSGVSAGMDMSLAIIEKLWGADTADVVVKATEYTRRTNPDDDPFVGELNVLAKEFGLL